jgi:hypothetical protein
MATIPTIQNKQGVLSIGSNTMQVAPNGYYCQVSLRFNNPIAYNISLSITRASLSSTEQVYSISLDAGDTVEDSGYLLNPGDRIVVDTSIAGTVYFTSITNTPYKPTP